MRDWTEVGHEEGYLLLKQEFDDIDKKYNRTLNAIELDFPDSLGLVKLTYTPLDDETLRAMATDYYQAYYAEELDSYTQRNQTMQAQHNKALAEENANYQVKLDKLLAEYNQKRQDFLQKAVKNSIKNSSIFNKQMQELLDQYNKQVTEAETLHLTEVACLQQKLQLLQTLLSQTTANLQGQQQAKTEEKFLQLQQAERKKSDDVVKYNNSVSKQEADFTVKVEKSYATVMAAEQRRAVEATNLFATVGASGVEDLKAQEKVAIAKEFFDTLTCDDATALFEADSTLTYHFGRYYDYMHEYVLALPN